MSETLAREADIHEFQCQKEPFLGLMINLLMYRHGQLVERVPGPGGRHPRVPVPKDALPGAHD
jgi:hypothetical protein